MNTLTVTVRYATDDAQAHASGLTSVEVMGYELVASWPFGNSDMFILRPQKLEVTK